MTDLTDQLDAIQARVDAATRGPWEHNTYGACCEGVCIEGRGGSVQHGMEDITWEDAHFIANAPTDIQDLLVLARKQQAAIDAVEGLMADPEHYDSQGPSEGYVSVENLIKAVEAKP